MGLSGRKQKQRIPADPRNLNWADDASRFGYSYLSKFGWDESQGLGSSGDGMKTHIKVQQKLDMMGIGAQHQRDPNGIAWKQNKDFEALLKRLNESTEQDKDADVEDEDEEEVNEKERETVIGDMFVRAQDRVEGKLGNESSVTTKKRKREGQDNPDTRKKKEKHKKTTSDDSASPADRESPSAPALSGSLSEPLPKPRPMAHRARIRAAKRIAGKPASAISEILGIASSSSVSSLTSTAAPTPTPPPTSASDQHLLSLDILTTSTKSVADYFKEKLLARSSTTSLPASPSSTPSGSVTPGLGASRPRPESSIVPFLRDDDEPLRRGIGCQAPIVIDESQGQDTLTEKQRRKVERKAEKRKQQEAEASQAISGGVSVDAKEQMGGDDAKRSKWVSKEDKKQKKRREREPQASTDQPVIAMPNDSFQEPNKKSKKERKKGHS